VPEKYGFDLSKVKHYITNKREPQNMNQASKNQQLGKPARLRSMPIRIAESHWAGLNQLRAEDGIAIQEHVRRALTLYLDAAAKKRARAGPGPSPAPPASPKSPRGVSSPKIVYR
jgi:hypothetical protein